MKVELSIKDDKELRAHIKDAIKGVITSIVRDEIQREVILAMTEKVKGHNEQWLHDAVQREIRSIIIRMFRANYMSTDELMPIVKEVVADIVKQRQLPQIEAAFEKHKFTKQYLDKIVKEVVKDKLEAI